MEPHEYLVEDLLDIGDITSQALISDEKIEAHIIAKENCVVAGMSVASQIFEKEGIEVQILINDGETVIDGKPVMVLQGSAAAILKTERLALNFIQRLAGIATITRNLVNICKPLNPNIKIAATRKTTPGLRKFEKDAVEIGGGMRHREGLYDQILIKDNHLKIVGSVSMAVRKARESGLSKVIEVEVVNVAGAKEAAQEKADIILLDNMEPNKAKSIAEIIRNIHPEAIIEISGGINPDNIAGYADFADVISLGWLTHSVKAVDFSMEFC
ncbi:MAG: carboxylating nicotinate-nucleotide diphosphorylase [Thermoplasmata archaeon]|nr:carboxylating nicotinate-nucleotide diphosphorylase [Thermoplasmata archaeon]